MRFPEWLGLPLEEALGEVVGRCAGEIRSRQGDGPVDVFVPIAVQRQ